MAEGRQELTERLQVHTRKSKPQALQVADPQSPQFTSKLCWRTVLFGTSGPWQSIDSPQQKTGRAQ